MGYNFLACLVAGRALCSSVFESSHLGTLVVGRAVDIAAANTAVGTITVVSAASAAGCLQRFITSFCFS